MFVYNVDGTNYTFESEIGQEEAEKKIRALNATAAVTKKEPRYEGFFTEAGEGILSGLTKIPEGIISTGTLVSDAITGGNATQAVEDLSLIHISEPTRPLYISYAVFCLKKKKVNIKTCFVSLLSSL